MPEGILPSPFSFSPDGSKLFYTHAKDSDGRSRLWVADYDASVWKAARAVGGALSKWDGDQVSPS
jgi:Tol biopolymer transport system component